eukprot:3181438-Karenia_brevis.AAC.1
MQDNEEVVYTLEDKDPSVLLAKFGVSFVARWFHMMFEASDRWQRTDMSIQDVIHKYQSHLKIIAPVSLK